MKSHSLTTFAILLALPFNLAFPTLSSRAHNPSPLQRRQGLSNWLGRGSGSSSVLAAAAGSSSAQNLPAAIPPQSQSAASASSSDDDSIPQADTRIQSTTNSDSGSPRFSYTREAWGGMNNAWLKTAKQAGVIDKLTSYIQTKYKPTALVPDSWKKEIAVPGSSETVDFTFQESPQYAGQEAPPNPVTWADVVDAVGSLKPSRDPRPWDNAVVMYPGKSYRDVAWMKLEEGRGGGVSGSGIF